MLTFTDAAREMIRTFMAEGFVDNPALRVAVANGSPFAPEYEITLVEAEPEDGDAVLDAGGFTVLVDRESASRLEGATVDYVERDAVSGFEVRNPRLEAAGAAARTGPIAERVQRVLDERINPGVAAHGGHITLVGVQENVVYLEMGGGCQGCGLARVTLRQGVERMIREAVPEVVEIRDVTDHAAGENPFY